MQIPTLLKAAPHEHYLRHKEADEFEDRRKICGGMGCLRDITVGMRNKPYAKAAKIRTIRIHDLRHPYVKPATKNILIFFVELITQRRLHVKRCALSNPV